MFATLRLIQAHQPADRAGRGADTLFPCGWRCPLAPHKVGASCPGGGARPRQPPGVSARAGALRGVPVGACQPAHLVAGAQLPHGLAKGTHVACQGEKGARARSRVNAPSGVTLSQRQRPACQCAFGRDLLASAWPTRASARVGLQLPSGAHAVRSQLASRAAWRWVRAVWPSLARSEWLPAGVCGSRL